MKSHLHLYNPKLINNTFNQMLLFKLIDQNYSDAFLNNGSIHLGTSKEYRKMEYLEETKGYGDIHEGMLNVGSNRNDFSFNFDGIDFTNKGVNGISTNSSYIFSMTMLPNINKMHSNYKYRNNIIQKIQKSLLYDYNHPKDIFLIINPVQFINKLSQNINGRIIGEPVRYVDNKHKNKIAQQIAINKSKRNNERLNSFICGDFVKDKFFKNQYEYRILSPNNSPYPHVIKIGPLNKVVRKLSSFEEIFN